MIKGPKAILSSAIAGALGEYFFVDANAIESNLLKDAKIILRQVKLKEQVSWIPINSAGKSTKITITGCVDEVAFTWAWSVGQQMWVDDAVLTITGAKFQATLDHAERKEEAEVASPDNDNRRESFVNPSTIDSASAKEIKKQKGGLTGFVFTQVKMVVDMLKLKLIDFELRVLLPPQLADLGSAAGKKVLSIGANAIEYISFGRGEQDAGVSADTPSKLKQRVNLFSFECGVHIEGDDNIISYPLIDPFSYSADVTRFGERFGGFLTGLKVIGLGQPSDGLAVHLGTIQISMLTQLSVMVLAPPTSSSEIGSEESVPESEETAHNSISHPSLFRFPLSSIKLVLSEGTHLVISGINMRYKGDGTICNMESENMEYNSDMNGRATASQIEITMRPTVKMSIGQIEMDCNNGGMNVQAKASRLVITSGPMNTKKMTVGCIEHLSIPDSVLLSDPIQSCEVTYEGNTLTLRLDTLNVVTFSKEAADTGCDAGVIVSAPTYLPCHINISIRSGMQIKKSEDGSLTKFGMLHLYALKEDSYVKVAIQCESLRNYLVSLNTISSCGSLPVDQANLIKDFIFTAGEITVKSGHSTDEWREAFRPRKNKAKQSCAKATSTKKAKSAAVKLPFATVADLKVTIGLDALKIGRVKDTKLTIKGFNGKAETTSSDLIGYFSRACLARAPNFISNAEVLGLNIVDSTAGMLSTWAGLGLGSAFGAGGGVAAITAVDAIKGAVDAGKRNRHASEDESWRPGDFVRGLVQAAGEAAKVGATKRGRSPSQGNIIDWTVGATTNTADYVTENKNRLGAAGAGGGGFLLGMALGGPIGAVVGGLVATATTGIAFESIDKAIEGSKQAKEEEEGADENVP